MNKKQSKRQRDIKSKLMAAICMLLVSSIMMVSTTYAWFTLSTAPEVTGISTAVGANGNLEIALQPYDGDSSKITSGSADSMEVQAVALANVTWGNLVDVSDNTIYGLENIKLYPSALNTLVTDETEGTKAVQTSPLKTPEYGADGRVAELKANTMTGVYSNNGFYENVEGVTTSGAYGVRAVGVASGMSPRQLAYRAALQSASTADTSAKRTASTSLNNNGSVLADVAISHAMAEGADTTSDYYDDTDVNAMKQAVSDLQTALDSIENALLKYILANSLANATDDTYEALVTAFEAETLTLDNVADVENVAIPAAMQGDNGIIAKLDAAISNADNAATALSTLTDGAYMWGEISPALQYLVNTEYLSINGDSVDEVMADPGALASSVMADGLTLTMNTGAGVYADIADFCGDYSASITIAELSYGTLTVPNVPATMNTQTSVSPVYLSQAQASVAEFTAADGGSSSNPISDFYGYIIDLAFRTNAADSYLLLQQEATDRIYGEDGSNSQTMGGGAYMSFTSTSDTFTSTAVKSLMSNIRIVFFDTDTKEIISYAALDNTSAETDTSGAVKMPLIMVDEDGEAIEDDAATDVDETIAIMALDQNTIHELSVMVYLDGESVTNADVAADSASSMEGEMNLQFASSATLVPMDYTDLKTESEDDDDDAAATTTLTAVTIEAGDTGVTLGTAVYDGTNIAIQLNNYVDQTVTIKVGDAAAVEVTPATAEGVTGITYAAADVAADTAIVVTVTAANP